MSDDAPNGSSIPNRPRFAARLFGARLALAWERAWPALWPPSAVVGIFIALALFDALPLLPGWLHALVLAALLGGVAWLLWRAVRGFVFPGPAAARRRIETDSGLAHRPLQTLTDNLSAGDTDPDSVALWRLHQQRMADAARGLRVGVPAPGMAKRDPIGLRMLLLTVIAIGVAVGGSTMDERFARALTPEFGAFAAAAPPKLELWITPPAYTGLAPLFPGQRAAKPEVATADGRPPPPVLKVPVGSTLTAQLSGGRGRAELVLGETRTQFEAIDGTNRKFTGDVDSGGRLAVLLDGESLGEWVVDLVPDAPPTIEFSAAPAPTARGALRIAFRAGDDYGLDKAAAEFRRTYERGDVVGKEMFELPLNLPGLNVRSADEITFHDLTPHHWAGLAVVVRLRVTDGSGQTAYSKDVKLVLPERRFRHPVARAIIEQRKRLTTEPEQRGSIVEKLGETAVAPGAYDHRIVTFLSLSSAAARLVHDPDETVIPPVREQLWDTALGVEDGRLSVMERELRRAQRELMKALSENAPDSELERLLRELENALNRFLSAMAQRMRNQPDQLQPTDPRARMMQSTDLQRMIQQIRDLLRSGNRRAAREMLAQLRNMLENMRAGRMQAGDPRSRAGNQAMRRLQDLIRRQSDLLNRSFRNSRGRQSRPGSGEMRKDADSQRALRETLKQLRDMLGRMGMNGKDGKGPGKAFGEADRHMGDAARALDRAAPGEATGPQGQALDALQRAGRGMIQQMMNQFARQSGMGMQRRFNPLRQRRDPLGRYLPNDNGYDSRDVKIPDEGAVERAQRILDELRRRAGQNFRPRLELDYIDRLLRRF